LPKRSDWKNPEPEEISVEYVMGTYVIALAPPMPLPEKLVAAFIMVGLATVLARSRWKRNWAPAVTYCAAGLAALTIITLELSITRIDDRGVLAALIGLVAGAVSVAWSMHKTQSGKMCQSPLSRDESREQEEK
jgi:hypothetical protein